MRYSEDHKTKTRQKIVASAHRLFTSKGYAATSIEEIMGACSLTRGGFYMHFTSKSQLYREAIHHAAAGNELSYGASASGDADNWIESVLDECLDPGEVAYSNDVSHLAFFATDVARQESDVRIAYTHAVKSMSERIRKHAADQSCSEESILSTTAMIIGTLAIAQTTDDLILKAKLFASCKQNARALLQDNGRYADPVFFWGSSATN